MVSHLSNFSTKMPLDGSFSSFPSLQEKQSFSPSITPESEARNLESISKETAVKVIEPTSTITIAKSPTLIIVLETPKLSISSPAHQRLSSKHLSVFYAPKQKGNERAKIERVIEEDPVYPFNDKNIKKYLDNQIELYQNTTEVRDDFVIELKKTLENSSATVKKVKVVALLTFAGLIALVATGCSLYPEGKLGFGLAATVAIPVFALLFWFKVNRTMSRVSELHEQIKKISESIEEIILNIAIAGGTEENLQHPVPQIEVLDDNAEEETPLPGSLNLGID